MVSCMVSNAPYGRADTMGKLFATTVTSARPREREYKLTDGAGLYLLVKPNGRKLWRLNYAYLGKQRTLSFGAWPDVSLADARERRDEARKLIAAGLDPSHEAKLAEARAMLSEENSFKLVAEEWVAKQEREGMSEVTLSKIRWLLAKAYPRIGSRPVAKITPQEALAVLRRYCLPEPCHRLSSRVRSWRTSLSRGLS